MTIANDVAAGRYDDFSGPELDSDKWMFLEYPFPDGSSHVCAEPNARVTVGDGAYLVEINEFENVNDAVQIIDNPKHLFFSKTAFELPESGEARFSVTMEGEGINTSSGDYRDGFAAFNVLDLATGWVFDLATSGDRIFAIHERLPVPGVDSPFTHCIDAPLAGVTAERGVEHRYSVILDRGNRHARWEVDGKTVYWVDGAVVPERVQVGFGVLTLHPLQNDKSVSLRGQGFSARWHDLSVELPSGT